MPFGLHRAATTFQQLVDSLLGPCKGFALAYLDDNIFNKTLGGGGGEWTIYGICIKCCNVYGKQLGLAELDYLGYTMGGGCLKPQPKKIVAIQTAPRPNCKKR